MTRRAAAMFDPGAGMIVGWAEGAGGRPARVLVEIGGEHALTLLATAPVETLGSAALAALGQPPDAISAFSARLPPHAGAWPVNVTARLEGGGVLATQQFEDAADYALFEFGRGVADSLTLSAPRLRAGALSAELTTHGDGPAPELTVRAGGRTVGAATVEPMTPGRWRVTAALPAPALSEGVTMVEFGLPGGPALGRYAVSAGAALASDLATEVAALRAELDLLKTAFRETFAAGVVARDERPMIIAEVLEHVDNLIALRDRASPPPEIDIDPEDPPEEWEVEG